MITDLGVEAVAWVFSLLVCKDQFEPTYTELKLDSQIGKTIKRCTC